MHLIQQGFAMHRLIQETPELIAEPAHPHTQPAKPRHRRRLALILAGTAMLAGLLLLLLLVNWPFTQSKVIADLEEEMQGRAEIKRFHQTYFPHPGCVAEDVTFTSYGNLSNPMPITVRKLTIQGSWRGLFTKHVPVLHAEGVHVVAPHANYFAGWTQKKTSTQVVVDEFIVSGSVLEFLRGAEEPPLKFEISELKLLNPGMNRVMEFETTLRNPEPPGEVHATGHLGPWRSENPGQTPIAGAYSLKHADLGVFHGIAGILSADGSFQGVIQDLDVSGKTEMADFEVTETGHKIGLNTQFQAKVSSKSGDVTLEEVLAELGKSQVKVEGNIAGGDHQKGKAASLELLVGDGQIQDFLFLLLKDRVPPMTGRFSFKGQATLPPDKAPFTQRIQLQGDFGISAGHLSNPTAQANLENLSERAEGEKDEVSERVVSDLRGHVTLRQGTAVLSDLSFSVPGALARMHGTYDLVTHRINLHGTLVMKANLSEATSGVKSFLLKIVNPLLKKNHRGGAIVPLSVTGIYPHPVYKVSPI